MLPKSLRIASSFDAATVKQEISTICAVEKITGHDTLAITARFLNLRPEMILNG